MSTFQRFLSQVKKGIEGNAVFLPLRQKKLGSKIAITKSMYLLFGGMPGSGKTAIVDSVFLLDIYDWWLENRKNTLVTPYWIYRSMERDRIYKIAKWTAYKMYKDHKILIDVPTLLGWPNKLFELTDEILAIVASYDSYFEELLKHVTIIDGADNPTGIWMFVKEYMTKRGTIEKIDAYNKRFVPNDPNEIIFHITDHVGKIKPEKQKDTNHMLTDKQILDKHSAYMGEARDFYGLVPIDISQLNREIEDTIRNLKTDLSVSPKDFKGSGNMYENADIVIGLMNPYKLKDFDHMDYDIKAFVDEKGYNRFRSLKVIKNSFGIDDFEIGYQFVGENGIMNELPRADMMALENMRKYLV
jgi:hypothetical protein